MPSPGRPQDMWKGSAAARPPGAVRTPAAGRGRWFAAALVVVALGGAIAGLLFYLWPDPPAVVLAMPVTAYDQPDWPPNLILTDFPLWNHQSNQRLSNDVEAFLRRGNPPIVFTPGSTPHRAA